MLRHVVWFFLLLFATAQAESSSSLYLKLKKLNVLGSVLYVAAHPDDENTQLLARLSRGDLYQTAYLSLTRGDGGQNLIGPELRDALGVIRTQELLKAREIDGCEQFFSSANDFGFSKHPDEALRLWDRQQVLDDVVEVMEKFQPDVVITRFSSEAGPTHGHHTASAILAIDAFSEAPWSAHRIVWNMIDDMPGEVRTEGGDSEIITLDINGYSALLGRSFAEIGALAVSLNRTQAFGTAPAPNRPPARFLHLLGEPATGDLFDGVDTSWSRLGAPLITAEVHQLIQDFDFEEPHRSVPGLLQVRREISKLHPSVWRERKLIEVEELIAGCLGLELDATTGQSLVVPGTRLSFRLSSLLRSEVPVRVLGATVGGKRLALEWSLISNAQKSRQDSLMVSDGEKLTQPYWLQGPHTHARYALPEEGLRGRPQAAPRFPVSWELEVLGEPLRLNRELQWLEVDPKLGPLRAPVAVVPSVSLETDDSVLILRPGQSAELVVKVVCLAESSGVLRVESPSGWAIKPEQVSVDKLSPGQHGTYTFQVTAPDEPQVAFLKPVMEVGGRRHDRQVQYISYEHIPRQVLTPACQRPVTCVRLSLCKGIIGYLPGAGDRIPEALENLGYQVRMLNSESSLDSLKAVVLGIRAFNTEPQMVAFGQRLEDYVKSGGTLLINYNTPHGLKAPVFNIPLTKNRITNEASAVQILTPSHPLLMSPNKLSLLDFEGWVQERGLYFPSPEVLGYERVLRMSDPGEDPLDEALLAGRLGEGHIIYNSLSLFRQLPAGVPGAYRLLANMLEIGSYSE